MANHMVLLARDPNLASELGKKARVRIQNLFSMERSIQGLYGVLETAVKRGRSRNAHAGIRNQILETALRTIWVSGRTLN
jgi:hypothetical protein